MGHILLSIVCTQSVSKQVQNIHKMADEWLQFETEPSVEHDCIFTFVSKSRMGKLHNPKCQIPNLRFCSVVSSKHFSQVKTHSVLKPGMPGHMSFPEFPETLEPRIGYFSSTACGSIDMVSKN